MASTGPGYFQNGDLLDYVAPADVGAGQVVVLSSLLSVAVRPIASGKIGGVAVEGVFALPCATGATGAQGSVVYYSTASGIANDTTGTYAGKLAYDRAATDSTVKVLLNVGR
jgi:predicted RecA/RadA family phage recombinase